MDYSSKLREYADAETDPGLIPAPTLLEIAQHIENQAERIKELETENRWIPVSERLPKERVKVLAFGPGLSIASKHEPAVAWSGTGETDERLWWTYGNDSGFYKPTHWKPIFLPEEALKGK